MALTTTASRLPLHVKARWETYPNSDVKRFPVPDGKVPWSMSWPEYVPVEYTNPKVLAGPVWADPEIRYVPRFHLVLLGNLYSKYNLHICSVLLIYAQYCRQIGMSFRVFETANRETVSSFQSSFLKRSVSRCIDIIISIIIIYSYFYYNNK